MENKKHILITGANGFVGSHLVDKALGEGYSVHVLVRPSTKRILKQNVNYHYADITSYQEVYKALNEMKKDKVQPDYIIHAAALTKSNSTTKIETVNCMGTDILYQCLKKLNYNPQKIVFISSLAASGPEKQGQEILTSKESPITTYGKSKLKAEKIALAFSLNTVIVRPTAVYGPGDKDLYSVFKLVKNNFNPLLGSHPQQLTFIYVKDLVNMIFSALHLGEKSKVYVATDGRVYDKKDFPKAVAQVLGKNPVTVTFPLRVVKVLAVVSQYLSAVVGKTSSLNMEKYKELVAESWMCDAQYSFNALNYRPEYGLKSGIEETIKWYKKHKWI